MIISEPSGRTMCEHCHQFVATSKCAENDYGEFICEDCEQNAAEAAYERFCSDFHDGGNTSFRSLRDQQIEARRFK